MEKGDLAVLHRLNKRKSQSPARKSTVPLVVRGLLPSTLPLPGLIIPAAPAIGAYWLAGVRQPVLGDGLSIWSVKALKKNGRKQEHVRK